MNDNNMKTASTSTKYSKQQNEDVDCGTTFVETEHYQHDDEIVKAKNDLLGGTSLTIDSLRDSLASDVIVDCKDNGPYTMITSPFERSRSATTSNNKYYTVPIIYCDQTASNRPLRSIEQYIEHNCLPYYGNTHTNTSITGSQSTAYVGEARQIVAEVTNAKITGKASCDIVLFTGHGTTSVIELFIDCINIKEICRNCVINQQPRPVVFIGPYEHHSNLIPWRETGCEIVMIPEDATTQNVDMTILEECLQQPKYQKCPMKVGTFTAASNVTGKLCNVDRIAALLHQHNALAVFDYATASSYTKIDMNPMPLSDMGEDTSTVISSSLIAKDAVFISPHKMIGGVGTPGVLIIKKHLVSSLNAPNRSGGGTVFYVTNTHHRFLSNRIHRYEGGTPNVIGIVRTGLTFLLKRQIENKYRTIVQQQQFNGDEHCSSGTPSTIEEYDQATYRRVAKYLKENAPNLVLLGDDDNNTNEINNLPIFSFLIRFGQRFLHYNYVCAILNDIFGIQSRGGCQCAGPYSQKLLGLVDDRTDTPNISNVEIEEALYRYKERAELLRPGYTRLCLPYKGLRTIEVEYVLKALVWISKHGWSLMCQYRCNHRTGEWRHANRQGKPLGRHERKWLSHYAMGETNSDQYPVRPVYCDSSACDVILEEAFVNAEKILSAAKADQRSIVEASKMTDADLMLGNDDGKLEELRWYVYPKECAVLLLRGIEAKTNHMEQENCTVLGAIQPLSVCPLPQTDQNSSDRKRKNIYGTSNSAIVTQQIDGTTNETPRVAVESSENSGQQKKGIRTSFDWGTRCDMPPSTRHVLTNVQDTIKINEVSAANEMTNASSPTSSPSLPKKSKFRHVKPPAKLMRTATQAIVQWNMINDGDRLLLGLSGGKDSLSLLHLLLEFKRVRPIKFDLEVCTIDPMTPSFDPSPLITYVESLGLKYHYIRDDIVSRANNAGKSGKMVSSLCAFCARMKRGNLYSCARRNKCNKLVLAQHLDDCAESMMMSMMHNGFLRTMKANYAIDAGDLSVIRPLIYCREGLMTTFAKDANLPVINENCPACFEEPKERARIKKMLSREETLYPNFYDNIRRSLIPLMHDDMAAILRAYTEEAISRSRKVPWKEKNTSHEPSFRSVPDESTSNRPSFSLADVSDDELVLELARRKAAKHLKIATNNEQTDITVPDLTGQVCSLNGGNGSIPCYELME